MIWSYVRQAQQLPSALRLPDNIDLGKLREEMDQGTRFAEQYLQKFGAEVTQIVNKAINVIDDDEYAKQAQEPEGRKSTSSNPSKRIFATRKERLLAEMRTDPDTFLTQVPGPVIDDVEKKTDEIALILEESPELRDMMDRLVPIEVSYVLFWQRYFHHAQKIEKEDEKRQIIAEGAQEELEFKWDSDDEDEATSTQQKKGQKIADEKKNDVDDKKIAASPVPTADKQAAADQSTKTEETKRTTASEDSDSDWE
ncbi:hypothetical protein BDB00DRAFT_799112 [Zychaea mexicana]|uniref:uncharacterized protein n=1 Tax=Zychaea mexicana TaxID=64656 RepID=UPI0022FF0331|nr:uncharacterized protein BDB00DRAFT_799112 [Zychaea mexicana]KAI9498685.1 hypothetical protein BDB00DRAFT_799112 [Zychaea mexicana]